MPYMLVDKAIITLPRIGICYFARLTFDICDGWLIPWYATSLPPAQKPLLVGAMEGIGHLR